MFSQSKHILDDFADMLKDVAVVEKPAKDRRHDSMSMVLTVKALIKSGNQK